MAFVSRTTRDGNRVGLNDSSTPSHLGPGTYGPQSSFKSAKPSYTPFGTTARRKQVGDDQFVATPGPGSYVQNSVAEERLSATSNAFVSGVQRFTKPIDRETRPGPGQYKLPSSFNVSKQRRSPGGARSAGAEGAAVKWVRVPTAPSIPAPAQSFGYEEGASGELILQRPPKFGHTGRADHGDTVGPGAYEPSDRLNSSQVRTDFGRSKSKRTDLEAMVPGVRGTDIGPGYYNAASDHSSVAAVAARTGPRKKPSSSFASGSVRGGFKKGEERRPGPGAYTPPSSFTSVQKPTELQFFGSTQRRFHGPVEEERAPGPGTYRTQDHHAMSGTITKRRHVFRSASAPNAGFGGEQRFKPHKDSGMPGPGGSGMPLPGMAEVAARKPTGRAGVFGSTTKRFHTLDDDAKETPAPGSYETKAVPGVRRRAALVKPSSTFRSASKRTPGYNASDDYKAPPPGAYDTANFMAMGLPKEGKGLMHGGGARWVEEKVQKTPGIGAYDVAVGTIAGGQAGLKQNHAAKRKGVMGTSGSRRFASGVNEKHRYVPGPGQYDPDFLYGNMLQPTFNISIAENEYA